MASPFMRRSLALVVSAAALLAPAAAQAGAPPNCLYDQLPDHVLFVGGDPEVGLELMRGAGGEILVKHLVNSGPPEPVTCTGTPTVTNTDVIQVMVTNPGQSERVRVFDPDAFAPGFTEEATAPSEIEMELFFGDGAGDRVDLAILAGGTFALGEAGFDWNAAAGFVKDVDISLIDVEFAKVNVYLSTLVTSFTGQGSPVTGEPTDLPIKYVGDDLRDEVTGGDGYDDLDGGGGRDALHGAGGSDQLTGGAGKRDRLFGDAGLDELFAKDGKRDKTIDCGPGANGDEKAKRDKGKDPQPKSC